MRSLPCSPARSHHCNLHASHHDHQGTGHHDPQNPHKQLQISIITRVTMKKGKVQVNGKIKSSISKNKWDQKKIQICTKFNQEIP